jgi:hypothetical protein
LGSETRRPRTRPPLICDRDFVIVLTRSRRRGVNAGDAEVTVHAEIMVVDVPMMSATVPGSNTPVLDAPCEVDKATAGAEHFSREGLFRG